MFSIADLCALCHTNSNKRTNILSKDKDGILIEEKLKFFIFELVHDKLAVSKHICLHCLENLNFVYKFKQMCLRNILMFNKGIYTLENDPEPNKTVQATITNLKSHQTVNIQNAVDNCNDITSATILDHIQTERPNDNLESINDITVINELMNTEINDSETTESNIPETQEKNISFETEIMDVACELNVENEIEIETTPDIYIGNNIVPKPVKILPKIILPEDALQNEALLPPGIVISFPPPTTNKTFKSNEYEYNEYYTKCNSTVIPNRHLTTPSSAKPYKCDICNKSFAYARVLSEHRRIHTTGRPYKCDQCNSAFRKKGNLVAHQRIHTGERPFKCNFCDKRTMHVNDIKRHVRKYHTKEHVCEVCNKALCDAKSLEDHVRAVHTKERPFACDLCDRSFPCKNSYRRHRRNHVRDGDNPISCSLCPFKFKDFRGLKTHSANIHKVPAVSVKLVDSSANGGNS